METIILIGSIIGIVNSFILVVYALLSKKGSRLSNLIFAFFILMLTLRISKSILLTFSDGLHDFLLTIGLSGFMAIGPAYYFFNESILNPSYRFKKKQLIHLFPAITFTFLWVFLDAVRNNASIWHIFYRTILVQFIIYITLVVQKTNFGPIENVKIRKQFNVISLFLMGIWLAYLLNEVAGFPYISGAILYSALIYFSLIIIVNKGYIIDTSNPKYQKTGLKSDENERILGGLTRLLTEEARYKDNTISLAKLARELNTSTHALSQVINENFQKSFFELIGSFRIKEAKRQLKEKTQDKISDIAFDVGYNSLSAFNAAFKKITGLTPSKYRDE